MKAIFNKNHLIGKKIFDGYNKKIPWIENEKLHGFWNQKKNIYSYIYWLLEELKIKNEKDFYEKLNLKNWKKKGYNRVNHHLKSIDEIAKKVLNKKYYYPWMISRSSRNVFNSKKKIESYLKWFFKIKKVTKKEDIYKINSKDLIKSYGSDLCDRPNNVYKTTNYRKIIIQIFPNYNLVEWKIGHVQKEFWQKEENILKLKKFIKDKYKFKKLNDWYSLSYDILYKSGSQSLISQYPDPISFLKKIFPNNQWHPWLFKRVTGKIWKNKKFRDDYIIWIKKKLGIKKPADWYQINFKDIKKIRGRNLQRYYKTILDLAKYNDPSFKYLPWKFKVIQRNYFNNKKRILEFINWIKIKYNYKNKKDFYKITYDDFILNGAGSILIKFNHSPQNLFKYLYPNYNWRPEKFGNTGKYEIKLFDLISRLFKKYKVIHGYRNDKYRFKKSKRKMELDIFIPDFNLGIEFQGSQHYTQKWGKFHLKDIKRRDKEKKIKFNSYGIKILYVSYKWKGDKETILKILRKEKITI